MKPVILQNTTLAAIVRDEMMNPAGGIRKFVEMVMPHVEQGVIIDTGSKDGTREALEDLKKEFSNLKIYDREFRGYAASRNFSLSKVETEWVIVLDADEVIADSNFSINSGFENLNNAMQNGICGTKISRINIYTSTVDEKRIIKESVAHNPRIFKKSKDWFYIGLTEWLFHTLKSESGKRFYRTVRDSPNFCYFIEDRESSLYHFKPSDDALDMKVTNWYWANAWKKGFAPSEVTGFRQWKKYNPHRKMFTEEGVKK